MRSEGIALTVDHDVIEGRRRSKDARDVSAIEDATAATEQGFALIRELLSSATTAPDGTLQLDGEALTSERVQGRVRSRWAKLGCEGELPIISGGEQGADPHEVGHGPLRAGQPIICDLFPRDSRQRYFSDMTRTFVVGEPPADVAQWHALCVDVLRETIAATGPGAIGRDVHKVMCDRFAEAGFASNLHPDLDGAAACPHGLGHGVGLDVHEPPGLGPAGDRPLEPGDVVTLEPGLYRAGYGGVRVEDLVLVTEDGCRNLSSFPYDLRLA
jgi:Xaa-Pro aminopeptidase